MPWVLAHYVLHLSVLLRRGADQDLDLLLALQYGVYEKLRTQMVVSETLRHCEEQQRVSHGHDSRGFRTDH